VGGLCINLNHVLTVLHHCFIWQVDVAPSSNGLTYTTPLLVEANVPLQLQYSSFDMSTGIASVTVSGTLLGQSGTVGVCAHLEFADGQAKLVSVFGVHDASWYVLTLISTQYAIA
jgi:hypothetical protein